MPFGFAGGLHDKDIGLVRFGFRDYDPDTGRWTAKDLIVLVNKNIDLYGYIQNDPINWIDPYGLFEWKTFGYGVLEISIGLVSFGVAYGVAFSTGGLGAAASVLVIYEGAFIFAVGLTDIIGAFYDEKPFVSKMPQEIEIIDKKIPFGSLFYPLLPDIPMKKQKNPCEGS